MRVGEIWEHKEDFKFEWYNSHPITIKITKLFYDPRFPYEIAVEMTIVFPRKLYGEIWGNDLQRTFVNNFHKIADSEEEWMKDMGEFYIDDVRS